MNSERQWLASYPAGVAAEVDVEAYASIVAVLQSSLEKYRDRVAFSNSPSGKPILGRSITYA